MKSLRALLYRRPSEPRTFEIVFDEAIYPVRSAVIGRRAATPCASMPPAARSSSPCRRAAACARPGNSRRTHGGWIATRLHRLPEAAPFAHDAILPLRGFEHRIVHRAGSRGTVWTETGEGGERCCASPGKRRISIAASAISCGARRKRDLEAASRSAAARLGVSVRRVSVRDQSSRWGSCSTTGVLSYSWRLILAPPFVLDYLAVHEVAHLVEMNHSLPFWRLVNRLCPDANRAKAWLDVHGTDLHRYGLPGEGAKPFASADG